MACWTLTAELGNAAQVIAQTSLTPLRRMDVQYSGTMQSIHAPLSLSVMWVVWLGPKWQKIMYLTPTQNSIRGPCLGDYLPVVMTTKRGPAGLLVRPNLPALFF